MPMHQGVKPSAQPRTLRTIAEEKGAVKQGSGDEVAYDPRAGIPTSAKGAGQRYQDEAEKAAALSGMQPSNPKPFK